MKVLTNGIYTLANVLSGKNLWYRSTTVKSRTFLYFCHFIMTLGKWSLNFSGPSLPHLLSRVELGDQ